MENNENTTEETAKKEEISYPFKSFEQTFQFVKKIYEELGHNTYHTRDQIAALHVLAPNSTKQPISSAQQFGLLEIKYGVGYKTTDLFARILLPGTAEEEKKAVLESLRKSKIYTEIFSTYEKSGILPQQSGLTNTLVRKGLSTEIASKVIRDFVTTLKNHNFLDDKNILRLGATTGPSPTVLQETPVNTSQSPVTGNLTSNSVTVAPDTVPVTIPLGNKRIATLILPSDFNYTEVKRISKFILAALDDPDAAGT